MALEFITELERGNKSAILKNKIISYYIYHGSSTIPELAKELNLSIPTITKLINEMLRDGILIDQGKIDSKSGRRPSIYGLNSESGYFLGVDIKNGYLNLGISDFKGELVHRLDKVKYAPDNFNLEALDDICRIITQFIDSCSIPKNNILNCCINISGRVNPNEGRSFSHFNMTEIPLAKVFSDNIGLPVIIDNDTRAMTYGELLCGSACGKKNVLYINLSWGLGFGIIINGSVYEGKSGFAGELGHIYAFDNEIMCHCGKKGCLETEVSGRALHRQLFECLNNGINSILSKSHPEPSEISLADIIEAVNQEDFLCIELIETLGQRLGKHIAAMINIFNPELVVIGGSLAAVGEYLLQPISQAVRKFSLNLVNQDSTIVCSTLGEEAGVIGSCMIARNRIFKEF